MIYVYIENKSFKKQAEYVFDNIFNVLGIEITYVEEIITLLRKAGDILILYVDDEAELSTYMDIDISKIIIFNSRKLFGDFYLLEKSLPKDVEKFNLEEALKGENNIISLYHKEDDLYINKTNLKDKLVISTNIDLISDIFFMLTRYEEVINKCDKDLHNRFAAVNSLGYKCGFLKRPIVNEDIELLWQLIQDINSHYKRKSWWGNRDFAACLTHDIDAIKMYDGIFKVIKHVAALLLKYKQPQRAALFIRRYFEVLFNYKKDPYWTFEYIINTEMKYDFRSSFYFMSSGECKLDGNYNIEDKNLCNILEKLNKLGFEAAYHGSFYSYDNFSKMKEEIKLLEKTTAFKSFGCRQHFLRFNVPITWEMQEKCTLKYDTTLGYAEVEGFRSGICFPYKPFDLLENRVLNIWEIPLIVMDTTLKDEKYRNLNHKDGAYAILNMIDTVKKYNGVFTMLWHNTSFSEEWKDWTSVYEDVMKYLYEQNVLGTSGREIIYLLEKK